MNIRDLISLTGSFFAEIVKEPSSLYDILSELTNDVYVSLFDVISANDMENVKTTKTIKYATLKLKFTYDGTYYIPDETDVAPFYLDDNKSLDGDDYIYGIGGAYANKSDTTSTFDEDEYTFSATQPLAGAKLANKLLNPEVELVSGVDFYSTSTSLTIKQSSLNSSYIITRILKDVTNTISGKEVTLYIIDAEQDTTDLYDRYGYLVKTDTQNIDLLKNIFRLYLLGPKISYINAAFNTMLGLPVIKNSTETIISISSTTIQYVIVTDSNTYTADIDAIIRTDIAIGTVLNQFDPLFDNITMYDTGEWWNKFDQLDVSGNIAGGDSILVENKVVQLLNGADKNKSIKPGDWWNINVFNDSRDTITLKVGSKTSYGETIKSGMLKKDVRINVMDLFFGIIWRNSLYYLKIRKSGISNENISSLNKAFDSVMPSYTQPIYYIVVDVDEDTPSVTLGDTPRPGECLFDGCISARHDIYVCPDVNVVADPGVVSSPYNTNVRSEGLSLGDGYYGMLTVGGWTLGFPAALLGKVCWVNSPLIKVQ